MMKGWFVGVAEYNKRSYLDGNIDLDNPCGRGKHEADVLNFLCGGRAVYTFGLQGTFLGWAGPRLPDLTDLTIKSRTNKVHSTIHHVLR